MCQQARVVLPPRETAPAVGRAFAAKCLDSWGVGQLRDDATLVVSELVTNAVVHAGSEVLLDLEVTRGALRVRTSDRSAALPVRRRPDPDADGGRGVHVAETLFDRFGVEERSPGKAVWGEFDLPAPVSCGCS
jgi:anti-sigma regulatory factor (Ser/Thr protein kinase)